MTEHQINLDCASKRVILKTSVNKKIMMVGERKYYLFNVISALAAKKSVCKGCEDYLAYILDTSVSASTVGSIRIVREFPDVFLEELPGLLMEREVDFKIDLLHGTTPVSITLYRIAPKELKELKV